MSIFIFFFLKLCFFPNKFFCQVKDENSYFGLCPKTPFYESLSFNSTKHNETSKFLTKYFLQDSLIKSKNIQGTWTFRKSPILQKIFIKTEKNERTSNILNKTLFNGTLIKSDMKIKGLQTFWKNPILQGISIKDRKKKMMWLRTFTKSPILPGTLKTKKWGDFGLFEKEPFSMELW